MPVPHLAISGRFRPEFLFRPSSVAVIGCDTDSGRRMLANLQAGGFAGHIWPVASGDTLAALPSAPDLAVLCCEASELPHWFAALKSRGTTAAIVIGMTGGLRQLGQANGVRSLGPGSFGVAVPAIGLNASRAHIVPPPGRVALVSQSTSLCRAVLDWAQPNGVGFSHIVGIGGNDDIGFGLVLDWLSRDAGTGVILLDIRRIKNARRFLSAARAAARLRPMVAMRAGGRLLDPTGHADAALEAALRRCGVLCVSQLDDMLSAAETLTRARPARNDALAIVTNAIGLGWMAADAALREGLSLATLSPDTRAIISGGLPACMSASVYSADRRACGDLIYAGIDPSTRLAEVASLLAGAREVGGVLAIHAPTGCGDVVAMEALAASAKAIRVPLLVCAMGQTTGAAHRLRLAQAGVPVFASPEQAVRGFLHLAQDRRNRAAASELPSSTILRIAPDKPAVTRIFAAARAAGRADLTQDEAMNVLWAYHIEAVPTRTVGDAAAAAAAAAQLGYPVVLKRRRSERPVEGGRGALALDLQDEEQLRDAVRMLERRRDPLESTDFLLQRQIGRARELLIRVTDDPTFGPIIGFGRGGTAASSFEDIAVDLPPLNRTLAHALIERTRIGKTLGALHDQPALEIEEIIDSLLRVSQLLVDFPEIAELDINPLFAEATRISVADAWIRLRDQGAPATSLAIAPYPTHLIGSYSTAGKTLLIRPIRPEDAKAHQAFFQRIAPDDVRFRFFSAMRELPAEQVMRLTQVDYDREIAFVAVDEDVPETVGVARLVRDMGTTEAEFAIVVLQDWKGRGLARHLMQRLIAWARDCGVTAIVGQILAENAAMIGFVRRLGFSLHRMPGEDGVVEARLLVGPP